MCSKDLDRRVDVALCYSLETAAAAAVAAETEFRQFTTAAVILVPNGRTRTLSESGRV